MNSTIPKTVVIPLKGLPELIENTLPMHNDDRDELLRQMFEFYMDENRLVEPQYFMPRLNRLMIYSEIMRSSDTLQHRLSSLATDINKLVYAELKAIGFDDVIAQQGGWFYIFDGFLPNGYFAVLKNIA